MADAETHDWLEESHEPVWMRLFITFVCLIAIGGSIALAYIVEWAVRATGHTGPLPFIAMLFINLVLSLAVLFALKTLSIWIPQLAILHAIIRMSNRSLSTIAVIAFGFVVFGIAAGIGFALGIL